MFRRINKLVLGLIVGLGSFTAGKAQVGESPFSIRGIGELKSPALIPNIGMGGIGVSVPYSWYLNNMNPAFLHKNTLVTFESGMMIEQRNLSTAEMSESNANAGISYIALGIPVVLNKWTLSAGWTPYSSLNYNSSATSLVDGTNTVANYNYVGSGGLNQAYIANGFRLNKNFSAGFRANYIFGNVINETITSLEPNDDVTGFMTAFYDRVSFSDFSFQAALGFSKLLNNKTRFNAGATYDISRNISGTEFGRLERRNGGNSGTPDTVINAAGAIRLPSVFNGGISFQRNNRWTIGSEVRIQNWSQYRDLEGEPGDFQNSIRVSLGGELIPDPSSMDSYLKRVTYRMGTYFERTPFVINGEQVNDVGVNFGTSLPVWGFSSLNLALEVGQRGSASIRDQYIKVFFGVTFNDKPWIKLPKYD